MHTANDRSRGGDPQGSSRTPRDLLDQAAALHRAGDATAAVSRARTALHLALDDQTREEAHLALERFLGAEREWRQAVERRRSDAERRERSSARPPTVLAPEPGLVERFGLRLRRRLHHPREPRVAQS